MFTPVVVGLVLFNILFCVVFGAPVFTPVVVGLVLFDIMFSV